MPRYDFFAEPAGRWVVWDNETGVPAELGAALIGLPKHRAAMLCRALNQLHAVRGGLPGLQTSANGSQASAG